MAKPFFENTDRVEPQINRSIEIVLYASKS